MSMKKSLQLLLPLLGTALALPLARADEPGHLRMLAEGGKPCPQCPEPAPMPGPGHRMIIKHFGPHEMETVAFLGVETRPASPALAAQLGLPKGSGLVVEDIVPDSPAVPVLKQYDVLLKLDDQLLVDLHQFIVLVRGHKAGDEVTLTYVRGGKQATAKVKLAEHQVPKLALAEPGGDGERVFKFRMQKDAARAPGDVDRMLALLDRRDGPPPPADAPDALVWHERGLNAMTVHPGNSNMVYSDEDGSLELTIKDGKKTLVAKNKKGEQVFSGPVDTPEQRKALAPEVRKRLEKIEGMDGFSFRTDGDFHGDVLYQRAGTKIALPLPDPEDEDAPEPRPEQTF